MSYRTKEQQRIYEARDKTLPPKDVAERKITGYTYKGIPIILQKSRGRPRTGGEKRAMEQGIFPQAKYVEAATLYAATGSVEKVSGLCGVPEKILRSWTRQIRFKDILEQIRQENDEKIDAKFCEIIEEALEGVQERIRNGDYQLDRHGELRRVPVKARDLSQTAATSITNRQLLRGKPTSRTENIGEAKRLELLAEQFIKMAQGKEVIQVPAIDGEYMEVNDAQYVTETSPPHGGSGPQPEVRQESGNPG